MDSSAWTVISLNRWACPATGIIFFLYFGLGSEAVNRYKTAMYFLLKPFGIRPRPRSPGSSWYVLLIALRFLFLT
jgi:hypothetical protein